jgi:hypothetical protein
MFRFAHSLLIEYIEWWYGLAPVEGPSSYVEPQVHARHFQVEASLKGARLSYMLIFNKVGPIRDRKLQLVTDDLAWLLP